VACVGCARAHAQDASERCRQLAVEAVLLLLARAPAAVLTLLPYAVPVLRERLARTRGAGFAEPSEVRRRRVRVQPRFGCHGAVPHNCAFALAPPVLPCTQEVRVKLVQAAHALLQAADSAVMPYGAELVELLAAALSDDTPEGACAACAAVVALCTAVGRRLGAAAATRLAEAATPLLTHRRGGVRLAALPALGALLHAGAHEHLLLLAAHAHPNEVPLAAFYGAELVRVNYLGKLATDAHAGVRACFVRTLTDALLRLPERADHAPLLLPYVLSGLADEEPGVAAAAAEGVRALGDAYEREHAEELLEAERYGTAAPEGGQCAAADNAAAARRGSRLLVRANVGHILPGCVAVHERCCCCCCLSHHPSTDAPRIPRLARQVHRGPEPVDRGRAAARRGAARDGAGVRRRRGGATLRAGAGAGAVQSSSGCRRARRAGRHALLHSAWPLHAAGCVAGAGAGARGAGSAERNESRCRARARSTAGGERRCSRDARARGRRRRGA
jgi:hypothetical protein